MNSALGWFVAALCTALTASAADWPQWRGPHRTGHAATDAKLIEKIPAEPKTIWRIKAGEGLASPVVVDGKAFLFDNQNGKETLRCVNAADAKEVWSTSIDDVFKDSQGPSGPRCTPVVDGDRVYVQSCRGELQCLSVADGKKIWGANFTKDFGATFIGEKGAAQGAARHGNNGSPAIDGDRLYAQVGSTNGASVVCFDKKTGKVIWKSQNDVAGYAAPMVATIAGTKQLVSFTADGVIGLKADDGELLWRVPVKTAFSRHATTPVIFDDIVVVSSHQVGLMAIRISKSGAGQKAEQAWLSKEAVMNFASPVAVGRHLYGLGPAKNIVCVDIPTGQMLWSKDGGFTTSADKAHATFLVLGQNVLMLTDGGTLVLVAADPKQCRELGRVQVCGANWCNPAYVDGKLFLRDGLRQNGEWMCLAMVP
ncbi:MAG TPA: PQQ-binding-like beta-propeller repeat protein [Candidatus Limnocylindria bacterium]|nr:PQQ-binding-like beta-propeller repeat protein [Candidatus Limnocylindria bacterium]